MLHSEGGLYMDVDDHLLTQHEATGVTSTGAAIDTVELTTTSDGLLLHPVMHNELMGMNSLYNNSMLGSHAGNPTLEAISEEMHARYSADTQIYQTRPSKAADPRGFYHFATELSRLTGPALLNDVVTRLLPDLYKLRQIPNLYMIPRLKSYQFVDIQAVKAVIMSRLPLIRVARVGNLHSWAHT